MKKTHFSQDFTTNPSFSCALIDFGGLNPALASCAVKDASEQLRLVADCPPQVQLK